MNYGHIVEEEALMNSANVVVSRDHITMNGGPVGPRLIEGDEMDLCDEVDHSSTLSNGNSQFNGTSAHSEQMGRLLCLFQLSLFSVEDISASFFLFKQSNFYNFDFSFSFYSSLV